MTRKIDKKAEYNIIIKRVLYSPPYFGAVMHKCCIGTSEVSRLMRSVQLMGDGCFNNIVDRNISSP